MLQNNLLINQRLQIQPSPPLYNVKSYPDEDDVDGNVDTRTKRVPVDGVVAGVGPTKKNIFKRSIIDRL